MTQDIPEHRDSAAETPLLDPVEARILGCLMEKQRTTPDNYPLTLNALVQACNQKTSRQPVMRLEPGEVGHAVNRLRDRDLIYASLAGRADCRNSLVIQSLPKAINMTMASMSPARKAWRVCSRLSMRGMSTSWRATP